MQGLLKASRDERVKYFQEATARSENIKNIIIIEKDFWVCWVMVATYAFNQTHTAPRYGSCDFPPLSLLCPSVIVIFLQSI